MFLMFIYWKIKISEIVYFTIIITIKINFIRFTIHIVDLFVRLCVRF